MGLDIYFYKKSKSNPETINGDMAYGYELGYAQCEFENLIEKRCKHLDRLSKKPEEQEKAYDAFVEKVAKECLYDWDYRGLKENTDKTGAGLMAAYEALKEKNLLHYKSPMSVTLPHCGYFRKYWFILNDIIEPNIEGYDIHRTTIVPRALIKAARDYMAAILDQYRNGGSNPVCPEEYDFDGIDYNYITEECMEEAVQVFSRMLKKHDGDFLLMASY
jgi:hypothetical protein